MNLSKFALSLTRSKLENRVRDRPPVDPGSYHTQSVNASNVHPIGLAIDLSFWKCCAAVAIALRSLDFPGLWLQDALRTPNLKQSFGDQVFKSWPVAAFYHELYMDSFRQAETCQSLVTCCAEVRLHVPVIMSSLTRE